MIELNVTGEMFDYVDFTESYVRMCNIPEEGMPLKLYSWGVTLIKNDDFSKHLDIQDDIYISGFSEITFDKVDACKIDVSLYKESNHTGFLVGENGKPIDLKKAWGNVNEINSLTRYDIGGVLEWPFGGCNIEVYSNTPVKLTIPEKSIIITAREYLNDVKKYSVWNALESK